MMKINLEYGTSGLEINVPEKNIAKVLSMQPAVPIQAPQNQLAALLETPVASPHSRNLPGIKLRRAF
jgi:hypothetical protein